MKPPSFNPNSRDALCLDGEPLALTSGAHLAAGAEYRTYRESFVRVRAKVSGGNLWFEAMLPNGGRREYGNTGDSRLNAAPGNNGILVWSLNREEDAFDSPAGRTDNDLTITYHEDESALVRQPSEISYGNGGDAKLRFVYTARGDPETVTQGGVKRTRHLLLHTVRAVLDNATVREYRLLSETTGDGWRRLDKAQLCGYDKNGANPKCLAALDVDWVDTSIAADGYKTCVSGVTDPLGRATTFSYGTIRGTGTPKFLFTERPFGAVGTLDDVVAQTAASDGSIKPVVTAVVRGNGVGGTMRTEYAYQGRPYRGVRNWGLVGFAATRVKDVASGVVTYLQHRLDDPHFAELAAEHAYDGVYGGASVKTLSKRWVERAADNRSHTVGGSTATTTVAHVAAETVVHHEGGTALGAARTAWRHRFETTGDAQGLATSTVQTTTVGTGREVAKASGWGEVPSWTFTGKLRERKSTFDLQNRVSSPRWLVGFVCQATEAHHMLPDGSLGPRMTVAPAGVFRMGCSDARGCPLEELPVHDVRVARPFALSTHEVTHAEYYRFARPEKRLDPTWSDRPATHLTWADAAAYAAWLAERTGAAYRLPSEAEWEWAARAGAATAYAWGDEMEGGRARCHECPWPQPTGLDWSGDPMEMPWVLPVASYPANAWGFHDMHGNAAEWTADCWHRDHVGAPPDGLPRAGGDCSRRVVRGGPTTRRRMRSALRRGWERSPANAIWTWASASSANCATSTCGWSEAQ